ncbi:arginyl-tRNA synthetase [Bradyrhizobium sp. GM6.1]
MPDTSSALHLFADVLARVHAVCRALAAEANWPEGIDFSRVVVEPPRDASHGDMATNAAMVLAKEAKAKPRDLAEQIAERLRADPLIAKVDVAGPGFINLTLEPAAWAEALRTVLREGADYGRVRGGSKVNVEYVSANPTGPMHVGHCRGAVFGDALASLLEFAGRDVTREYYINDAGAQVDVLARSAFLPVSRGARRRHRRDAGRPLSRRLSEAGRAGAGAGARRQAPRRERGRVATDGARQGDRDDDGRDQG